jgi:hypothetical protein
MSTIVIMPGGFHPFHAGHMALYNSARKAFPDANLYVAATNSQETRPFPFAVKEKLAKVAGVAPGHFVQVKSPFQAKEITQNYDPERDVLIFVRSEKDRNESPKPGGMKKDGTPAYFQPYTGKNLQPFAKHAYFAYLPTVEFGPGITSATEIRKAWPTLNDRRKTAMVMSLYPATQNNPKLAANVVAMLDQVMGGQEDVAAGSLNEFAITPDDGKQAGRWLVTYMVKNGVTKEKIMVGKNANTVAKYFEFKYRRKPLSVVPYFDNIDLRGSLGLDEQSVVEGAPIVIAQAPIDVRNPKKAPQPYRNQGDIVPPTKPPSTEKRGVKGRPGQRPMPTYDVDEGLGDVVKGIKRKVAGKEDPKEVEHTYGRIARSAIKHKTPDQAEKDIKRWEKVNKVVNKEDVAEGSDGWIGNPAKWKEAVLQAHGPDVVFKNYTHPGQPGQRSVNAMNAQGKQVGVYQRHNKMGMVQPNQQGVAEGFGLPMPGTYEQENDIHKGPQRIIAMTNEDLDPEMHNIYTYAMQHYPNAKDKQEAFVKYVQRALGHSENDDTRQDQEIEHLGNELEQLKQRVDYLEEK